MIRTPAFSYAPFRVKGAVSGAGFEQDLHPILDQRGRRLRREGDAALTGDGLFGYSDFHTVLLKARRYTK